MKSKVIFGSGCKILAEVLLPYGFRFVEGRSGKSSGGDFQSGKFVKDDRELEVHFRHSLGLVTYRIGGLSLSHEAYLRGILGPKRHGKYPATSDDDLEHFRALASDLRAYCNDFLAGPGEEFGRCVRESERYERLTGMEKLSAHES